VFGSVQRFRTVSNQAFLDRGTVRRGVWFIFLEFAAFEREKCGCIFFEPKAERLAKRRGRRPESAKAAGASETGPRI
jgi:hypothetical protein